LAQAIKCKNKGRKPVAAPKLFSNTRSSSFHQAAALKKETPKKAI